MLRDEPLVRTLPLNKIYFLFFEGHVLTKDFVRNMLNKITFFLPFLSALGKHVENNSWAKWSVGVYCMYARKFGKGEGVIAFI